MDKVWIVLDTDDQHIISVHSSIEGANKKRTEYINSHVKNTVSDIQNADYYYLQEEMEEEVEVIEYDIIP